MEEVFYADEPQALWSTVRLGENVQNLGGYVHGGLISTVFDQTFGVLCALSGFQGVTANLAINFRRPTPFQSTLLVKSVVDRIEGRKIFMEATVEIYDAVESEILADSTSLFMGKLDS